MPGSPPGSPVRSTRQRAAVAALLEELDGFRSAQEVYDLLRGRGERVGLTTVYRSLQMLAAGGSLDVLRGPDGEISYRRCTSSGHHHHLVCRACGHAVEFDLPGMERTTGRMAAEHGFTDVTHVIEVFGLCRDCSAGDAPGR